MVCPAGMTVTPISVPNCRTEPRVPTLSIRSVKMRRFDVCGRLTLRLCPIEIRSAALRIAIDPNGSRPPTADLHPPSSMQSRCCESCIPPRALHSARLGPGRFARGPSDFHSAVAPRSRRRDNAMDSSPARSRALPNDIGDVRLQIRIGVCQRDQCSAAKSLSDCFDAPVVSCAIDRVPSRALS